MVIVKYIICCVYLEFTISPTTVILFPGDTSAVFTCQFSTGALPSWEVNGITYTIEQLSDGVLNGHSASGTNIVVSLPVNGTKYVCVILSNRSDPAFLYIAGELHVYMCKYMCINMYVLEIY